MKANIRSLILYFTGLHLATPVQFSDMQPHTGRAQPQALLSLQLLEDQGTRR